MPSSNDLPQGFAGFPSPAADHVDGHLSLDALIIRRPAATFFMRVCGSSMVEAGIADGDLLVVDRSLTPKEGDIVVACIDAGFMVKRLTKSIDGWQLTSQGSRINLNLRFPQFISKYHP